MRIVKKLLDVCDFQGGTQPPKEEWISKATNGYVRMLQIRDYSQGAEKFIQYVKDNKSLHKCKEDDIMLSRYGYIGQAFTGLAGAYNVALVKVVKKCNIETQYLLYYFQSDYFKHSLLSNVGARATIPGFNKSELATAQIPVPSTEEQRRISKILSSIDQTMEKYNQQLSALDELIKSRFIEIVNEKQPIKTAEEVCSVIIDCPHSTPRYDEAALIYPSIRTSEIRNGEIDWSSMKYVGENEYYERTKRLTPQPGDIVYAREGTYGDCVILPVGYSFCLGQRTMLFRPDGVICNSIYLHQALRSDDVKRQANESNAGSTVPHVNVADAKKFSFPLPSIAVQSRFAAFVAEVDKSKLAVKQSLEKLETLKKSLMQQYFG